MNLGYRRFLQTTRPNPSTTIAFTLARRQLVRVAVYDAAGRRVAVLADGWLDGGPHQVGWGGMNDSGRAVSSGVYFVRRQAGRFMGSQKLVMVR